MFTPVCPGGPRYSPLANPCCALNLCATRTSMLRTHRSTAQMFCSLIVHKKPMPLRITFLFVLVILPYLDANVHQNYIRTDLLYVLVGNANVRFAAQDTQHPSLPLYNDFADASAAMLKFQIDHPAQFFAIPDIDHIFTPKF